MAAVAERAPSVREQRLASIAQPAGDAGALRIFPAIPPRYGVLAVDGNSPLFKAGEVAVYDELWTHEGLVDGGIYVAEWQRPTSGMDWNQWFNLPGVRSHLHIDRALVRLARSQRDTNRWMMHPVVTRAGDAFVASDGPFDDYHVAKYVIGRVVGIYNPAAFSGEAA
jgi:hypothetical protein